MAAEYLGLPSPPNSLDPNTRGMKLLKGVNFASSGSGYLNITGILYVIGIGHVDWLLLLLEMGLTVGQLAVLFECRAVRLLYDDIVHA